MQRLLLWGIGVSSLAAIGLTALIVATVVGTKSGPAAGTSLAVMTSEPVVAGFLDLPEISSANAAAAALVSDNAPAH